MFCTGSSMRAFQTCDSKCGALTGGEADRHRLAPSVEHCEAENQSQRRPRSSICVRLRKASRRSRLRAAHDAESSFERNPDRSGLSADNFVAGEVEAIACLEYAIPAVSDQPHGTVIDQQSVRVVPGSRERCPGIERRQVDPSTPTLWLGLVASSRVTEKLSIMPPRRDRPRGGSSGPTQKTVRR